MNYYVGLINETVEYIERSMGEKLSLSELSRRFGISDFHFNRMFRTVSGMTLKQYILGRKLTKAMELLRKTGRSVLDTALDLGFEYPEVFSRAFKKQFGIPPAEFRDGTAEFEGISKACIVERDIINYRGVLALKGSSLYSDEFCLTGGSVEVNVNSGGFRSELLSWSERTASRISGLAPSDGLFYTVVNCHREDNGEYTVFFGRRLADAAGHGFQRRVVPAGWYVRFSYCGDMFDIRESFNDDLYRWIIVNEAEIEPNGIGMVDIYDNDYPRNNNVRILIPVKKPV